MFHFLCQSHGVFSLLSLCRASGHVTADDVIEDTESILGKSKEDTGPVRYI